MNEMTMAERIRARAYELWQQDGCLEGCADEYWHMARALVEKEIAFQERSPEDDPDDQSESSLTARDPDFCCRSRRGLSLHFCGMHVATCPHCLSHAESGMTRPNQVLAKSPREASCDLLRIAACRLRKPNVTQPHTS
ncbi:DUF2934 domain-containing protein [Paraburkholderia caledonica]|uniref:DUF2934 domain-containing protein n=1 Tax=Paraburkholderia caledonica TaxID=134536 RepID=UPI0038BCCF72